MTTAGRSLEELIEVLEELIEATARAARLGGRSAVAFFGTDVSISTEAHAGDLVREANQRAEMAITEHLRQAMPELGMLSEEGSRHPGASTWVVDVVDRTPNSRAPLDQVNRSVTMSAQDVSTELYRSCDDTRTADSST